MRAAVALGVLALVGALGLWLWRPPSGALVVPGLRPLKLPPRAARAADTPESESATEDAPLMPVGTRELPEQLDRRQLEAGMEHVRLDKCLGPESPPFQGTITVHLTIGRSGGVQSVQALPPAANTPIGLCVAKQVQRTASFPAFRGSLVPTVDLIYPIVFPPR